MRRARRIDELMQDPHFPYHIGQLVGATEMAAWVLTAPDANEEMKRVGAKLTETVGWFFTDNNAEGFGWTGKEAK